MGDQQVEIERRKERMGAGLPLYVADLFGDLQALAMGMKRPRVLTTQPEH